MKNHKEEHLQPPNKFGSRHVQVLLLFFGMLVAYGLRVCMSVAIAAMRKDKDKDPPNPDFYSFDWDSNVSGLILSSFFWGYILTQIPIGHFASTHSAKKILAIGMGICSFLNMWIPFLADYGYIPVMVCRVVMGLTQGCLYPCVQTLLSRWVPPLERARLGSLVMNGPQLGTVLTMPISGALAASSIGWPSIFYIFGISGVGWGILFYCLGSDRPSDHPRISTEEANYINESIGHSDTTGEDTDKRRVPWRAILTSLPMWAILTVHCGHNWGYYTLLTEMPTYMKSALNFDISESGGLSALPYLAMWLLGFPISYFSDLAIRKGASLVLVRKICNSIGLWIPAAIMIVLCLVKTTDKVVLVAILALAVGFQAGAMCGFQINHIDLSPNYAGIMMSVTNAASNIFGIIAPLVCSAIVIDENDVKQWHSVFYMTAGIYIVTNICYVVFGKATIQSWNNLDVDAGKKSKCKSVI